MPAHSHSGLAVQVRPVPPKEKSPAQPGPHLKSCMSDTEFKCLQGGQRARFFMLEGSKELIVYGRDDRLCCEEIPGGIYLCSQRCARALGLLGW
jgi:hypothetical protein